MVSDMKSICYTFEVLFVVYLSNCALFLVTSVLL